MTDTLTVASLYAWPWCPLR